MIAKWRRRDLTNRQGYQNGSCPFQLQVQVQYKAGMSQVSDKRKQSLYFPEEVLREIQEEAIRQDRSLSWIVQQAWRLARERISKIPSIKGPPMPPSNS